MKRRSFIALALAAPAFIHSACRKSGQSASVRYLPETEKTYPMIEVRGDYYDIGYFSGKYMSNQFHAIMEKRKDWVDGLNEFYKSDSGSKFVGGLKNALAKAYPQFIDEINGMAAGSEIDPDLMFAMSVKSEISAYGYENPGCSTIYYNDGMSNWLFQNEDGEAAYNDEMYVLKAHPPSGVSFAAFVYPGLIPGVAPGFNSAGVVHSSNFIGCLKPRIGIPRYFLARACLEAKSLDDAFATATREGRAFPWHHNLASMNTGRYISLETLPEGEYNYTEPEWLYIHTNHTIHEITKDYKHQDMDYRNSSSISRYNVLSKKAENFPEPVKNPEVFLGWLSSHEGRPYSPCRHPQGGITGQTLGTAFFDLDRKFMRLYKSNPCVSVPKGIYQEFSLSELTNPVV